MRSTTSRPSSPMRRWDQESTALDFHNISFQITRLLSAYILSKKHLIFDKRNIKLALVENDPLGKAFGVTAFHRCQVTALLRTQLIPVHPNSSPDQLSTTTNKATYSRVAILL